MRYRYNQSDVNRFGRRFELSAGIMDAVGLSMAQQVKSRFATQGQSSGLAWPKKRMSEAGYQSGRAILTGVSGALLNSFSGYGELGKAIVFSDCPYSKIHQLGTLGKQGVMPDIRPKKAKALFIPITDRAIKSERMIGAESAATQQLTGQVPYGHKPSHGAHRFGVTLHGERDKGITPVTVEYSALIKGRIKDGRLERWNESRQCYEAGTPDFIWLTRVSIPARPMLPNSEGEIRETVMFLLDAMWTNKSSGRLSADGSAKGGFHAEI